MGLNTRAVGNNAEFGGLKRHASALHGVKYK